jgi:hypothetical protein
VTSRAVRSVAAVGVFLDLEHSNMIQLFVDDDDGELDFGRDDVQPISSSVLALTFISHASFCRRLMQL